MEHLGRTDLLPVHEADKLKFKDDSPRCPVEQPQEAGSRPIGCGEGSREEVWEVQYIKGQDPRVLEVWY